MLSIQMNFTNSADNCARCGKRCQQFAGPELYDDATGRPVCWDCGYAEAPALIALLELGDVAGDYALIEVKDGFCGQAARTVLNRSMLFAAARSDQIKDDQDAIDFREALDAWANRSYIDYASRKFRTVLIERARDCFAGRSTFMRLRRIDWAVIALIPLVTGFAAAFTKYSLVAYTLTCFGAVSWFAWHFLMPTVKEPAEISDDE